MDGLKQIQVVSGASAGAAGGYFLIGLRGDGRLFRGVPGGTYDEPTITWVAVKEEQSKTTK